MNGFVSFLLKMVYFLIVFGMVVLFAYYTTRLLGKKVSMNSGKYMKIIDVLHLGSDKSLVIVKAGKEYILLTSTAKGIEIVRTLDGFDEVLEKEGDDFKVYLEKYNRSYRGGTGIFKGLYKKFAGRDGLDEEK
jgi:flagellar biogenesis protein FliO